MAATSVLLPSKPYGTLELPPHTCLQRLTLRAGNRLDRQCHAQQHQQGLGAWRAPRQSAGQDGQPGRLGPGLQTWRQQSQKANVVEGHEDENVPDHRHHPLARHHHRPQWYVLVSLCPRFLQHPPTDMIQSLRQNITRAICPRHVLMK
jgi:hypothetical protein